MKRSAPSVHVLISRFEYWNTGLTVLSLASLVSLSSWLVVFDGQLPALALASMIAGSVLLLLKLMLTLRGTATSLRWDGQRWHAGPAHLVGSEPWVVSVTVRINLSSWMLLELRSDQVEFPAKLVWVPLQRKGMETHWHGLRCALFAGGNSASPDVIDRVTAA